MSDLPRSQYCRADVTIENCESLLFEFETEGPTSRQIIVARGQKSTLKPIEKDRIRDLRPGDKVELDGEERTITKVEIHR